MAIYLEHIMGAFPFWLAPEQAVIVPVNNEFHLAYCDKLHRHLKELGFRVKVDDRNESTGFKTRQIQTQKVPFMIVVGDREIESSSVNIRKYGEKRTSTISCDELISMFKELNESRNPQITN